MLTCYGFYLIYNSVASQSRIFYNQGTVSPDKSMRVASENNNFTTHDVMLLDINSDGVYNYVAMAVYSFESKITTAVIQNSNKLSMTSQDYDLSQSNLDISQQITSFNNRYGANCYFDADVLAEKVLNNCGTYTCANITFFKISADASQRKNVTFTIEDNTNTTIGDYVVYADNFTNASLVKMYDENGNIANSIDLNVNEDKVYYFNSTGEQELKSIISQNNQMYFGQGVTYVVEDVQIPTQNAQGAKVTFRATNELQSNVNLYLFGRDTGEAVSALTQFSITAKSVTPTVVDMQSDKINVTLTQSSYEYMACPICPQVTVSYDGNIVDNSNYQVECLNNINVGQATIIITFDSTKYNVLNSSDNSVLAHFDITPQDLTDKAVAIDYVKTYEYCFLDITPNINSISCNSEQITTYSVSNIPSSAVGDSKFAITFDDNYTGTKLFDVTVNPFNLSSHAHDIVITQNNISYTGLNFGIADFDIKVMYNDIDLNNLVKVTENNQSLCDAGTYAIEINTNSEYVASKCEKNITISRFDVNADQQKDVLDRKLSASVVTIDTSRKKYNEKEHTLLDKELQLKYAVDSHNSYYINRVQNGKEMYTVSYVNNINAGVATVTLTLSENSNFFGQISCEFIIDKAEYKSDDNEVINQEKNLSQKYVKGLTLQDISLNPNWKWEIPTQKLDTVTQYQCVAVYNRDPQNYEDYKANIILDITKGNQIQTTVKKAYEELGKDCQYTLSCVYFTGVNLQYFQSNLLDSRFEFNVTADMLNNALNATYTNGVLGSINVPVSYKEDEFYEKYVDDSMCVFVSIQKAQISAESVPTANVDLALKYNKNVNFSEKVCTAFETANPLFTVINKNIEAKAGDVQIQYTYNCDPVNYFDYSATAQLHISKGDYSDNEINSAEYAIKQYIKNRYSMGVVYDESTPTLQYLEIMANYRWANPQALLLKGDRNYSVIYCDDENYNEIGMTVSMVVNSPQVLLQNVTCTSVAYDDLKSARELLNLSTVNADLYIGGALRTLSDYGTLSLQYDSDTIVAGDGIIVTVIFVPYNSNFDIAESSATIDIKPMSYSLDQLDFSDVIQVGKAIEVEYDGLDHSQDVSKKLQAKFPANTTLSVKVLNTATNKLIDVASIVDAGTYSVSVVPSHTNYAFGGGMNGCVTYTLNVLKRNIGISIHNKQIVFGVSNHTFSDNDYTITGQIASMDNINITLYVDGLDVALGVTTPVGQYPLKARVSNAKNYNVTISDGVYTITPKQIKCSSASTVQNILSNQKLKNSSDVSYAVNCAVSELELPSNVGYTVQIMCDGKIVNDYTAPGNYTIKVCLNSANYTLENDTFTFTVEKDYTGIIYISVASAVLAIIVGFIVFLFVRNIIASKKNKFNSVIE